MDGSIDGWVVEVEMKEGRDGKEGNEKQKRVILLSFFQSGMVVKLVCKQASKHAYR